MTAAPEGSHPAPTPDHATTADQALSVRPAHPGELAAAGAVVRLAYQADGHHGDYLDVVGNAEDRARDAQIAVAVDGQGQVLGCVTFVLPGSRWSELSGPGEAEFRMLGVHPHARGRGVGRALTRWCIDQAGRAGARRLLLCSLPSMTAAHGLYTGLGFRRLPELDLRPYPGLLLLAFELPLG
jgi:ribosomal protein S18 acetylase RimI-like enzyme